MCNLYEKIEQLCQNNGIKVAELARATNINKTVFSELKNGRTKFLSTERLILIADYFDISLDELVGRKRKAPDTEMSEVDCKIMERVALMSDSQKELYLRLIEELAPQAGA